MFVQFLYSSTNSSNNVIALNKLLKESVDINMDFRCMKRENKRKGKVQQPHTSKGTSH